MRLQNPFAAICTASIDSQVLTVLARSDQYLTIAEIHRLLPEGGSPEGVRKSTARLVDQGTLVEQVTGRSQAYSLNRVHLLVDAILQISAVKLTLFDRITQIVSEWEVLPTLVQVFGSAARNEMSNASDIDLLVIWPDTADAVDTGSMLGELASRVESWTGNELRPLVYMESEVSSASIFTSILAEGVHLYGDPNWLRRRLRSDS